MFEDDRRRWIVRDFLIFDRPLSLYQITEIVTISKSTVHCICTKVLKILKKRIACAQSKINSIRKLVSLITAFVVHNFWIRTNTVVASQLPYNPD